MNARIPILIFLLFSFIACGISHGAQCNGSASMLVPAVVGDGSGAINISLRLVPGNGGTYLSAYPQTGTSTQQSAQDAAAYAFEKAGVSGCDAIVTIDSGSASYVEGPSAGAAMAVLAYGAATGLAPRQDAMMTGAVDRLGNVGPVGGLYEKSLAAAASGARYFLTPKNTFFDILLLRNANSSYGLQVVEAQTMDDAIGFMLLNKSLPAPSLERKPDPVPDVPQYAASGPSGFSSVAAGMISLENRTVQGLPVADNDSASIAAYYSSEAARQEQILGKGYTFTAANEAFMGYIEASTVAAMVSQDSDLKAKQASVARCIASLPESPKTDSNFEWLVGADVRKSWASNRLNSTDIAQADTLEAKYVSYNDLMYADAWCSVSGLLRDAAGSEGTELDESAWKGIAAERLAEAGKISGLDEDLQEHLDSARLSFDEGRYGAALFDCTYAIETSKADADMAATGPGVIQSEVQGMLAENRTSLWGSVYRSHAAWLAAQNDTSLVPSAFSALRYARGLDAVVAQMAAAARPAAVRPQEAPSWQPPDTSKILVVVSMFLIIIVLFYMSVRKAYDQGLSDGAKRGTKGPRYVSRIKQKQG